MEIINDDHKESEPVVKFFKQLIFTQLQQENEKPTLLTKLNFTKTAKPTPSQKELYQHRLPFQMIVNQITRDHILTSMNIGRCRVRDEGRGLEKITRGKEVVKAINKMEERRVMRKLREGLHQQQMGMAEGAAGKAGKKN